MKNMKKYLSALAVLMLSLCLLLIGCGKRDIDSELSSSTQNLTQNESANSKVPSENIMANYYGMTIGDVIEIWGSDYVLNDYLLDATFASIEYKDGRCPFLFYYRHDSYDMPTSCDVEAQVAGIGLFSPSDNQGDFYVTENVNAATSYKTVATKLNGEYGPDDMWGGNSFNCTEIENVDSVWFTWITDPEKPSRIKMHFKE